MTMMDEATEIDELYQITFTTENYQTFQAVSYLMTFRNSFI